MDSQEIYISAILPAYNEADSVQKIYSELKAVLIGLGKPFEIIFVNDGSNDKTLEKLKELSPIKIIDFRRNFGQTAAMDAGIKASLGKLVVTLDADGQNDPADIPKMLEVLKADNLDLVVGWRKKRQDKFLKILSSKLAGYFRKFLINDHIHDSGCTLKVFRRECFRDMDLSGEMHRFIPGLLKIRGFEIGEVVINHRPRVNGRTKYNWHRGVKGGLDIVSVWFWRKYANRPLHLFGTVGLFLFFISFISGCFAVYLKIFKGVDLSDTALTNLSMFGILISIQLLIFGLLADMISRNYFATTKDRAYFIKEIIEK